MKETPRLIRFNGWRVRALMNRTLMNEVIAMLPVERQERIEAVYQKLTRSANVLRDA